MRKLLLAIDRRVNAWLGGRADETISSAVGRKAIAGRRWAIAAEALIDLPFALLGERNHCAGAIAQRD